ncbi:unnamed protein product [Didymodactylos carnosus]|uniref:J domain-containing protein n=1 Tax=Didymodactylos carnosus TaxID=1234261 RepID=A0A813NS26_9BILA|nr:unnamed protein product [Didymodactylos carnosus]CAF0740617.1 unnamed protein product [Didymodactylos carnosus]CAF3497243.1 unnamed protein product [Didymodactylos carnosus]CAF3518884.1 unnamed protein product [Didymodactylos carnosus]
MPAQSGLLAECNQHFKTNDLYEIFTISRTATEGQVKKAYRQLALRFHPDRTDIDQKEDAKQKFQIIGKIYAILSDEEKRKTYDHTGMVDDSSVDDITDWFDYCKKMFRKVTKNDLVEFENKYKDSNEELEDLKRIYLEVGGDMDQIFERHLLTRLDDEQRLREMLDKMIEEKEIPAFDAYTKESKTKRDKRHRKLTKEAVEAEKLMKELNIGQDDASLTQAIQMRQQEREKNRDNFFDQLLNKYGGNKKTSKKGATPKKNNKRSKTTSLSEENDEDEAVEEDDNDDEEYEDESDEEQQQQVSKKRKHPVKRLGGKASTSSATPSPKIKGNNRKRN